MDLASRAEVEMRRQLLAAGMPVEMSTLVASNVFDLSRLPRRAPLIRGSEVEAFEAAKAWIEDHGDGGAKRADVEHLLDSFFGADQTVYERLGLGLAVDPPGGVAISDAATGLVRRAIKAARSQVPERWLRIAPHQSSKVDLIGEMERATVARVSRDAEGLSAGNGDPDHDLLLRVYSCGVEALWAARSRYDAMAADRFTVEIFFEVIWGWLQSFPNATEPMRPSDASHSVHAPQTRCFRCGLNHQSEPGDPTQHVIGPCVHEFVTDEERHLAYADPVDGPEDLARRIAFAVRTVLPVPSAPLDDDPVLPQYSGLIGEWLIDAARRVCHVGPVEQSGAIATVGELFDVMRTRLEQTPASPYTEDRVTQLLGSIGPPTAGPGGSSWHRPSAIHLAGALSRHLDDIEVLRGRVAAHVNRINYGRCPRCLAELERVPAGSRATICRCIPVCSACGNDEATGAVDLAAWPVMDRRSTDESDIVRAAFAEFLTVPTSVSAAPGPRWSYESWPKRILGRTMTAGPRQDSRVQARTTKPGEVRSRALGCILGGAVGDALGAPVEFMSLEEIGKLAGQRGVTTYLGSAGPKGSFTDDTQMTLWTIEGLIRTRQRWYGSDQNWWSPLRVTNGSYRRWLMTQGSPIAPEVDHHDDDRLQTGWLLTVPGLHVRRAPGNTCLSAMHLGGTGTVANPINDSKGCGGVMRVAPAGLIPFGGGAFELGSNLAAMTHGHPSGYLASGAFAMLIRLMLDGSDLREAVDAVLAELEGHNGHEEVDAAMRDAIEIAEAGTPSPERIESLGGGWVAEEALAIAVCAALTAEDLQSGVLLAVNHSGDSDSTGSMAGQLLGAMHGVDAIPREWIEALEMRDVIERLTNDFVDAFHENRVHENSLYPPW